MSFSSIFEFFIYLRIPNIMPYLNIQTIYKLKLPSAKSFKISYQILTSITLNDIEHRKIHFKPTQYSSTLPLSQQVTKTHINKQSNSGTGNRSQLKHLKEVMCHLHYKTKIIAYYNTDLTVWRNNLQAEEKTLASTLEDRR